MLGVREEGAHKNCVPQKNREGGKQGAVHHCPLAWMPQHYVPKSVVVQ